MSNLGYLFGFWLGGFVFPMIAGYAFLLPASSHKRTANTATLLRISAVLAALFLAYASYIGTNGRINLGAVVAVLVVLALAVRQQSRKAI